MPLSAQQKSQVTQFTSITNSDKKAAERLLKQHGWNVQRAVDGYYGSNGPAQSSSASDPNTKTLNKLFDKYRDQPQSSPDIITITGTMSYLHDLSLTPDDIRTLILSTLLSAPTLGTLNRTDFVSGWLSASYSANPAVDSAGSSSHSKAACTTLDAQSALLAAISGTFGNPADAKIKNSDFRKMPNPLYRRVYKYTFTLALPQGANVRAIPLEEAAEYWLVLFGPSGYHWRGCGSLPSKPSKSTSKKTEAGNSGTPWLDWWLAFLQEKWRKAVNRDLWEQTLAFAEKSLEDETLGFWSEDAAWPGVVDEFVEWVAQKRKGDGGGQEGGEGEKMEVE